jgi:acyl-CoA thioesterase-2
MPQRDLLGQPSALSQATILDLLDLERIEENLFRSRLVFEWPYPLYGGQVAAQALYAAGQTVPAGRVPHSLHGYFLRGGRTNTPTVFQVERDRDGGSFSARRVVAIQDGKVIFNMSASFAEPRPGIDQDADPVPDVPAPDTLPGVNHPYHVSLETRPADEEDPGWREHTRFWIRCTVALPDDALMHACVLTYMSDISTGLMPLEGDGVETGPSLDHAVWFHRQARMDDWALLYLVPRTVAGGRGWYTGAVYRADGVRVASIAQEALFSAGAAKQNAANERNALAQQEH